MGKNSDKKRSALRAAETREKLVQLFPKAFMPKGEIKKPLKRGIMTDLMERAPDIGFHLLKLALRDYCRGPSYHVAFVPGAMRIDLDGNEVEALNADAIEHALKCLAIFKPETQDRWRASREAAE